MLNASTQVAITDGGQFTQRTLVNTDGGRTLSRVAAFSIVSVTYRIEILLMLHVVTFMQCLCQRTVASDVRIEQ
ncbi:MAG: hypothetical protein CMJ78_21345 [Planctomycetaceae bacterium]|nr:hypothetical protein [Planctomycetaceae bacterium]